MLILQLLTILMGGIGGANPWFIIKNDDMCVIFGWNKKFQPTVKLKSAGTFYFYLRILIGKR